MNIKQTTSPLRWMGAKRRLTEQIAVHIPDGVTQVCSPFCGGCSFELALARSGVEVFAADNSELLWEFWVTLKSNPEGLVKTVKEYFLPLPSSTYYWAKKEIVKLTPNTFRAAMFYAINRASFSGAGLDGGMEPGHPAFTVEKTEALLKMDLTNMHFSLADFKEHLHVHPKMFAYLDPPYVGVDLSFGEGATNGVTFDHLGLQQVLKKREKWVLSYDNHPTILQLYANHKILYPELTYSTRSTSGTGSRDVIILSEDLQ